MCVKVWETGDLGTTYSIYHWYLKVVLTHYRLCRYFFEPKEKIMLNLKEQVEGASSELKQLSATRENLSKKQDSLVMELKELF
jgi:hypothetical protein